MNGEMGTIGEANSKPGPVKRTIAKLRHKGHDDTSDEHRDDATHNTHSKTEDYTGSVTYALVRELFQYLNSQEGQIAIRNVITTQAKVAANLAVTDGAKEASRVAALQAVKGSYDAAESKYLESWKKLPGIVKATAVPLVACYVAFLAVALLLTLWRFVLYGTS